MAPSSDPTTTIALANGVELPILSVGMAFWFVKQGQVEGAPLYTGFVPEMAYKSTQLALEAGNRSFDTALVYRTQSMMRHVFGEWMRLGKIERKDLFVTTKVYHPTHEQFGTSTTTIAVNQLEPEQIAVQMKQHVEQCVQELGLGYVDLMLLHWPGPPNCREDTPLNRQRRLAAWRILEEYYNKGWLRAIGVSNFTELHLKQLEEDGAAIVPHVNQIEASVFWQWQDIVEYCAEHKIVLQAFSPFGHGDESVVDNAVVRQLADKYGKDAGQVAIRYLVQKQYAVVFSSSSLKRLASNQQVFDFQLSDGDMKRLDELNASSTSTASNSPTGQPTPYRIG